jgi:hypothetical protein
MRYQYAPLAWPAASTTCLCSPGRNPVCTSTSRTFLPARSIVYTSSIRFGGPEAGVIERHVYPAAIKKRKPSIISREAVPRQIRSISAPFPWPSRLARPTPINGMAPGNKTKPAIRPSRAMSKAPDNSPRIGTTSSVRLIWIPKPCTESSIQKNNTMPRER